MTFVLEAVGLAAYASTIGSVVSGVGTVLGALSQVQAGQQQQQLAQYNAQIARNNAAAAELSGQQEAGRLYDINRRKMATARATQGATGADINMGSPVDVQADLAGQAALDEEIARWRGRAQGQSYRNEATSQIYQGNMAANAAWGRAGTMLLTGFGRMSGGGGSTVAPSASPAPFSYGYF